MSDRERVSGGAGVRGILERTTRLCCASLPGCLPTALGAVLCAQLPHLYWLATGHRPGWRAQFDPAFDGLVLLGSAGQMWLMGAVMLRQRALRDGPAVTPGGALAAAGRRLPALLAAIWLALLGVAAGLLLLVPGLWFAVCCLAVPPAVMFEGRGALAALRRSVALLRPCWWQALAALVIAALLFFLGALLFAAVLSLLAQALAGAGPAFAALEAAGSVGLGAVCGVVFSALLFEIYCSASSSA